MNFVDLDWDVCAQSETVTADRLRIEVDRIEPDLGEYDLVFLPGGPATRDLCDDESFLAWLRTATDCDYLTSVCTGTLLLGAAGFLDGRRATTTQTSSPRFGSTPKSSTTAWYGTGTSLRDEVSARPSISDCTWSRCSQTGRRGTPSLGRWITGNFSPTFRPTHDVSRQSPSALSRTSCREWFSAPTSDHRSSENRLSTSTKPGTLGRQYRGIGVTVTVRTAGCCHKSNTPR